MAFATAFLGGDVVAFLVVAVVVAVAAVCALQFGIVFCARARFSFTSLFAVAACEISEILGR